MSTRLQRPNVRNLREFRRELARWFAEKPDRSRWIVVYDPAFAAFQRAHDPVKVAFARLRETISTKGVQQ